MKRGLVQVAVQEAQVIPYEDARAFLRRAKSLGAQNCICRKEQSLLDSGRCDSPVRNGLLFDPVGGGRLWPDQHLLGGSALHFHPLAGWEKT